MIIEEKINELRKARDENRLVVFVGAGVSNNSGIPLWSELVRCFAEKLPYDKCEKCNHRKNDCPTIDCKDRYNFSQDEYLKIPQFFYNKDKSKGKARYYQIIKETLDIKAKSNPIHNLIMNLYPKHIITTNFDKLIENTQNPNSMLYKVIIEDKELLTQISNNYIIKMHGDIDNLEKIVLKESDYLNYQQDHILIETFIKSLLMNHTFLFVGYSLNDYNVNLIMSWVENLATKLKVKKNQRPKHFIIQSNMEKVDEYIEKYFLEKNLFIIDTSELPVKLKEKSSTVKLNDPGKNVYAVLDYIFDINNDYLIKPLIDILYEKYKIFKNQNRISFEDLISTHSFGNIDHLGQVLIFYDKSKFKSLKQIIISNNNEANFIKKILINAGIQAIQYEGDLQHICNVKEEKNIFKELIELEQLNKYSDIPSIINKISDVMVKAYYYYVFCVNLEKLIPLMEEAENNMSNRQNYLKLLIFKYNIMGIKKIQYKSTKQEKQDFERTLNNIPKSNQANCIYLKKIYEGNCDNIYTCNKLADKCEEIYTKKTNTIYLGNPNYDLLKLQAIAYDYYYYIKMNNLMLDHFTDPKNILEPYIRAMLCTYSPKKERPLKYLYGFEQLLKEYEISSTDFDIIIKHTNSRKLKTFISDFNIRELKLGENIEIENKFINLCNSISLFPNRFLVAYLKNFIQILTICQLDNSQLNIIFNSIYELLFKEFNLEIGVLNLGMGVLFDIYGELLDLIKLNKDKNLDSFPKLLCEFLKNEVIDYFNKNIPGNIQNFYKLLKSYSNPEIEKRVSELIDNKKIIDEKIKMIYQLRFLFNDNQKSKYFIIVKNNVRLVRITYLFDFIIENYLNYNKEIENYFYETLQKEVEKKKAKPGVKSYPDLLVETLESLIIIFLIGRINNLKRFSCFAKYSDHLSFLLDPETFDYSKINTENYMWLNFMRSKKYFNILKKHGSEIIENLKKSVENGYATESQKILLYRYFLKDKEMSVYI